MGFRARFEHRTHGVEGHAHRRQIVQERRGPRLKETGVIVSYICPLMYMNNPLCKKKAVITNSNKLRTYTSARYYTDAEILDILTGKEGR